MGFKGFGGEFVECGGTAGRSADEFTPVSGSNTMGWIIGNGYGTLGFGGKEFFEGIDPSEGHDRDEMINGDEDDL